MLTCGMLETLKIKSNYYFTKINGTMKKYTCRCTTGDKRDEQVNVTFARMDLIADGYLKINRTFITHTKNILIIAIIQKNKHNKPEGHHTSDFMKRFFDIADIDYSNPFGTFRNDTTLDGDFIFLFGR